MPKRYNWTEIDSLAEYLSADEIVKYLKLGRISASTRARIEDLITRKKLTLKLNASKTLKSKAIQGNLSALKRFTSGPDTKGQDKSEPEKSEDYGYTQTQYANMRGCTKSAVNQRIKNGTIGWNGKHGKECRVWDLPGDTDLLSKTRIEKMQTETALKRQQLDENRRANFREVGAIYIEATRTAFATLHAEYVNLRLDEDNIERLRKIGESALKSFERIFDEYLETYLDTGNIKSD